MRVLFDERLPMLKSVEFDGEAKLSHRCLRWRDENIADPVRKDLNDVMPFLKFNCTILKATRNLR